MAGRPSKQLQKSISDLVNEFGVDKSELKGKTVEELDLLYNTMYLAKTGVPPEIAETDNLLGTGQDDEVIKPIPRYYEPEWNDYVVSLFTEDEKDKTGHPKVDGLRRVTELLLGEVIESFPVQSTCDGNVSAVNWRLSISWREGLDPYIDINRPEPFPVRTFGAYADATAYDNGKGNCKPPYANFLSSMADTRAEAKAYRRALRLRVIASEEAQLGEVGTFDEKVSDGSYPAESPITSTQEAQIKVICLKPNLNIDFEKLAQKQFSKELSKLTREQASSLIVLLNKYQSSVKDSSEEVPEDIKCTM